MPQETQEGTKNLLLHRIAYGNNVSIFSKPYLDSTFDSVCFFVLLAANLLALFFSHKDHKKAQRTLLLNRFAFGINVSIVSTRYTDSEVDSADIVFVPFVFLVANLLALVLFAHVFRGNSSQTHTA